MDSIINEVAPVWQRVTEFALERLWIEYFLFLIPLLLPLEKGSTIKSYTIWLFVATIALLVLRKTLAATGPWGAMRNANKGRIVSQDVPPPPPPSIAS